MVSFGSAQTRFRHRTEVLTDVLFHKLRTARRSHLRRVFAPQALPRPLPHNLHANESYGPHLGRNISLHGRRITAHTSAGRSLCTAGVSQPAPRRGYFSARWHITARTSAGIFLGTAAHHSQHLDGDISRHGGTSQPAPQKTGNRLADDSPPSKINP